MATKTVQDSSLTAVADAIRAKTGGSGQLVFPNGFVDAVNAIASGWSIDGFIDQSEPSGDVTTYVTSFPEDAMIRNTGITILRAPNATIINAQALRYTKIKKLYCPLVTELKSNSLANTNQLEFVDFGALKTINSNGVFYGSTKLATMVLRANSVCSLSGGNRMTNTPILKGTGTVYVPQSLISDYIIATGWSTAYSAGTQFLAIEGSIYDE